MPIIEQVNQVLFKGKDAAKAVNELMLRDGKLNIVTCRGSKGIKTREYSTYQTNWLHTLYK